MSTVKGTTKKKGQRYQNTFSFKHNKNSKLTKKIQETPLNLLCERCLVTLQWKIKYRKYKPLTNPAKCRVCDMKNVLKGHRTVCDSCALEHKVCSKCIETCLQYAKPSRPSKHVKKFNKNKALEDIIEALKERQRRTVQRKLENGEKIKVDSEKGLISAETGEVIFSLEEIGFSIEDDSEGEPEGDEDVVDGDDEMPGLNTKDEDLAGEGKGEEFMYEEDNEDRLVTNINRIKEKRKEKKEG
eukprot:CAMPEP_0170514576 /NCGR_PEP_ID=MMETSP0209-20121228/1161_1 /TAXON_ID=665100 ORGANISM="Litonotus pictus, Strain P1" /NCGR_SAMPLE_ID=MMETSP0209 /ASSEMBLY_ACC=CAM_ASM_000301 /LENGTH=241 /DNA_ID=CAMNT_0010798731 /DNA_START=8 /DNA_END=729 /DNA_ORIENTATION=+